MKHIHYLFLTFVVSIISVATAAAQGKQYVGYSDGKIASSSSGKYTSMGEVGNTVSIAIRLSKEQLATYKGCNIIGVNYGMPTSQGVKSLKGWVRNSLDGNNLTEGTTNSTNYGWREIGVTPYTISGEEPELWIGASYDNDTKAYVAVSFAGTAVTDGCYANNGNGWTNYATQGWGSLSLEAIIEGANVATRDLALLDVTTRQRSVQVGEPINVSGLIKNNASETAKNPIIRYSINGQEMGTYTCNESIAFRQSQSFAFDIPTTSFSEAITANVTLSLEWADGLADDAPADNVSQFSVELAKEVFKRRMVVEEHTGAWCGWCVRGIVGLKEMKEQYGDDFISIGIHNNDMYAIPNYDSFISGYMDGFPNCIINRSGSAIDPSYSKLASRYMSMDAQADADISLEATYDTEGKINFSAHSRFAFSETNADYRVAFVVLENKLPLVQKNFYSGGTSVMGGFERLESEVLIEIDDVARGIYPNPTGDQGSIPASITKGDIYDYNYSVKPTFSKAENVEVAALLINAKTGEIINAVKTDKIEGLTSGEPVTPVNPGGGDDTDPFIPLSHTLTPADGTTVTTLDHVLVTFAGTESSEMSTAGNYNFLARSYSMNEVPVESYPYLRSDDGKVIKAIRLWKTANPDYAGLFSDSGNSDDPFINNEFQIDFDGVPAGHYTLVVPKYTFVYYDTEDYLCGTKEFTAEYTVTTGTPRVHGNYATRFVPAEFSELKQFDVVTLYSTDDIYNYNNSDLGYHYNYYYPCEVRRPYVILPGGAEIEAKYVDYLETTGVSTGEAIIQLTFPTSYTQGVHTLVFPEEYIVVGDDSQKMFPFWGDGFAAPERRFTFFVGSAPEGISMPSAEEATSDIFDLWGRKNSDSRIIIKHGHKVMQ